MRHRKAAAFAIALAGLTLGGGTASASTPTTDTSPIELPGGVTIDSMTWPSATDGWVLAGATDGTRVLLHTTDRGASWAPTDAPDVTNARAVLFADASNGWIVGDDGVQSTHDGGATWTAASIDGMTTAAAVTAAGGTVHVAYLGGDPVGVEIASSPIDHDAFVASPVDLPAGAGPLLDVSMSAGGDYAELIYNDRTLTGAAEIRDGQWTDWDLTCPYANPYAVAGLSPGGAALAIACSPSGFGDNDAVVGANLSSDTLDWATIAPAGDPTGGQPRVDFATATDDGVRIVGFTAADGTIEIATSTDEGATWQSSATLPTGSTAGPITHLPDGSLLMAAAPGGGLFSPDGLTWTPVTAAAT